MARYGNERGNQMEFLDVSQRDVAHASRDQLIGIRC